MSEQQNNSFFDKSTIMAIALVGVVFFGWQQYLNKKYPDYYKKPTANQALTTDGSTAVSAAGGVDTEKTVEKPGEKADVVAGASAETVLDYQTDLLAFKLSSVGMGLKEVTLSDYKDSEKNPLKFSGTSKGNLFETRFAGATTGVPFKITQKSAHEFEGVAQTENGVVRKTIKVDPGTAKIETTLVLENAPPTFPGLVTVLSKAKVVATGGNFLMPSMDHQDITVKHAGSIEHLRVSDGHAQDVKHESASIVAIGSQYFVSALVDKSEIAPAVHVLVPAAAGDLEAILTYKPVNMKPNMEFKWVSFVGGKSLGHLQNVDAELTDVVNFGFFSLIGKWLLRILIWSHSLVGNWGWAVVVMTILVRLMVMPFNIASYRSMKKMQLIQPHLQSLRERYKGDPAALNRESMLIMKEHKVNPIGGCLPMLLQMPIFFAFYQVLGQSIELYQSPFILWIHDLSQKDPFFILPVLMGVTMFIQQKITPTTMDPMQAKILQWMPIIFSAFTLALPSGLTLYIFVSTLFGVLQQRIFMRDTTKQKASSAVIEAKVEGRT